MDNILYPFILSNNIIWYSKTLEVKSGDSYIDFKLGLVSKNHKITDLKHFLAHKEIKEIDYIKTLEYDVYKIVAQSLGYWLIDVPFIEYYNEFPINLENATALDLITLGNMIDYGDYKVYQVPQTFIFRDNIWYEKNTNVDLIKSIEIEIKNDNFTGYYDNGKFFLKIKKVNLL
jgi:hypothetical protein